MGENIPAWRKRSLRELDKLFEQKQFRDDLKQVRDGSLSDVALIKKYDLPIFVYIRFALHKNQQKRCI